MRKHTRLAIGLAAILLFGVSTAYSVSQTVSMYAQNTMGANPQEEVSGRQTTPLVVMYTTRVCPYCEMATRLLNSRGVTQIQKIAVDTDPAKRDEMIEKTGRRTVPQIFIGDVHVGGYDDLAKLDREGKLLELLQPSD